MDLSGKNLRAVSFPVGGIGAGCIGVAGNGDLAEWEVFNRPRLGGRAVAAQREGGAIVLARPLRLEAGDTLDLSPGRKSP